ncbi:MAG: GntR family transcriptional regulator [Gammaproteobacteria bacterium]|nr:GntR family transcriptional regulator [Gammaproteobacteria bacterium]
MRPTLGKHVISKTIQLVHNRSVTISSEQDILRRIEQAVHDHRLPPGTKLKEVQLAELFGVKRGTIRKVLTQLANSRLVEQRPNRGASVARPSAEEGRHLFATRRVIESAVIKTLVANHDQSTIDQLRDLLELEQQAYQQSDSKRALALSVDFHRQLAILAGNTVMLEYLTDIMRRTPLVILTHLGVDTNNRCRNQEHAAIVDAIADGDAVKATEIMDQHLLHIEDQISDDPDPTQPDLASLLLSEPI